MEQFAVINHLRNDSPVGICATCAKLSYSVSSFSLPLVAGLIPKGAQRRFRPSVELQEARRAKTIGFLIRRTNSDLNNFIGFPCYLTRLQRRRPLAAVRTSLTLVDDVVSPRS